MSRTRAFTMPRPALSSRALTYYAALTIMTFFAVSAAPTPLYHYYQRTLHLSPLVVTLIFAAYSFSMLAAFLTVARLSDYVGRRPMILAALLLNALALALFIIAQSAGMLIIARIIQGIATGIATTTLGATILDTDPRNGPTYNSITPMIGLAVGVLLAGALLTYAPLPGQLVYAVLLGVTLVGAAVLALFPETVARRPGAGRVLVPHVGVPPAARPVLLQLSPLNIAAWALAGFYFVLMPTLVAVATGIQSPLVGAGVVSVLLIAAAIAILALRPMATERVLMIAVGAVGLGVAITLAGTDLRSVTLMLVGTAIAGIGCGAGFSGVFRQLLPLAAPTDRAGLIAAYYIESYLAYSLPSLAAGQAIPTFGLVTTTYFYGGALLVLIAVSLWALRAARRVRVPAAIG